MTEAGRVRRRMRPFLFVAMGLSVIWATYWLWTPAPPKPDFVVEVSSTDIIENTDYLSKKRHQLPLYTDGRFFSVDGQPILPRDVIRDERHPSNVDYYQFTASFFMEDGATQADFARAIDQIWDVCNVPIFIAAYGLKEMPALLPVRTSRDCESIFPPQG